MFKRVLKRRRRQEEDEELGLDGETKEMLGWRDIDDSSSDSDSDSDSASDNSGGEPDERDVFDEDMDDEEDEIEQSDDDEEGSDAEEPPVSLAEALKDPLYTVSQEPDVQACIVCPGKIFKHETSVEVHRSSNAHIRKFKRFVQAAEKLGPDADVKDVLMAADDVAKSGMKKEEGEPSKRQLKRQAREAAIAAKRKKRKELKATGIARKATKALTESEQSTSEKHSQANGHAQKERKVDSKQRKVESIRKPSSRTTREATQSPQTAKTVTKSDLTKSSKPYKVLKPNKSEQKAAETAATPKPGTKRKRAAKDV
ncbi:hypothetical protein WOLCODRAFT_152538 [Wolfiporia cocos MD-104 SS10]|uniref:Uncharacterized protein n=1 Tax=Wolfiporia cocos (strain MD-104) TaxID=742152 RepID=A0A2H3JKV6_WOLCO|nr:hypothetical protein WOLCODRAFT_152538 [Wolfiporia cocos MD-104 SS10]